MTKTFKERANDAAIRADEAEADAQYLASQGARSQAVLAAHRAMKAARVTLDLAIRDSGKESADDADRAKEKARLARRHAGMTRPWAP